MEETDNADEKTGLKPLDKELIGTEQKSGGSPLSDEKFKDDKISFLNSLLIAEGGLEDAPETRSINIYSSSKSIKQFDSYLSKTRLFPLNIHIIMVKFSMKCQARIDENRCLRDVRASEELLERKFSSSYAVPGERRKSSGRV